MLLSILIPTLTSRAQSLAFILGKLERQIHDYGLTNEVEILVLEDQGETPTGTKRNRLMERARGRFVVSVDDDDDIHARYVPLIVETLRSNPYVDCIGIKGEIIFREGTRRTFAYSTHFRKYRTRAGAYERPPHHLNPVRREIALRFPFEPVRTSEDSDWALRLSRAGALQREVFLDEVLYYYRSRRSWRYQQLLDWTEFIRHPLGIQWVNRLRIQRLWRTVRSARREMWRQQ